MLIAYVFVAFSVVLLLSGTWLLITGRNFPGMLGRGFTSSDMIRMQRAPALYWRVGGAIALTCGLFGLPFTAIAAAGPPRSRESLIWMLVLGAALLIVITPLITWFLALSARYRLFRWDKP